MYCKYSFIVPMYNVENYINQCIDSILMQNYEDYEIILVNDGSTDNTEEKCLAYSDDRIHYYRKENGGLSDARNFGIEKSNGDFLIFIDSDDFYCDSFLGSLNDYINDLHLDVVLLNSKKYYSNCKSKVSHIEKNIADFSSIMRKGCFKACAWDKVVKRNLIFDNNLFFPKGFLSEDILWCGLLLQCNPTTAYFGKPIYMYRQRDGSISKSISTKHINDMFVMISQLSELKNEKIETFLSFEYASLLFNISKLDKVERINFKTRYMEHDYLLKKSVTNKALLVFYLYKLFGYDNTCGVLKLVSKFK